MVIDSLLNRRADFATNWSLNAGTWVANGNLELFGIKPEVGGQAGLRFRRVGCDLTALFRFLDSDERYRVRHKDSLIETDNFFSVYLGVDPVYRVFSSDRTAFELFGGLGYDGIMALTADQANEDHADYLNSFSVSAGLSWRWFYNSRRTRYIGLQARYNIVNHHTGGGTDLSGNSVSVNLIWGAFGYGWVDYQLENLGYFDYGR